METDKRIKQLLFRSQHRGFNEMDQLLGSFAHAELAKLNPAALADYEQLLNLPDWDVYGWLVGQQQPPENFRAIVDLIRAHISVNRAGQ